MLSSTLSIELETTTNSLYCSFTPSVDVLHLETKAKAASCCFLQRLKAFLHVFHFWFISLSSVVTEIY